MEKGFRFRIYPNKTQEMLIQKTFGCVRYVYNHYLAKRIELYKADKTTFGYLKCSKDLLMYFIKGTCHSQAPKTRSRSDSNVAAAKFVQHFVWTH